MEGIKISFCRMIGNLILCLRRVRSLVTFHNNKIFILSNLGLVCFSLVIRAEAQKLSSETSVTLKEYDDMLADRAMEVAVIENSFGYSDKVRFIATLVFASAFFMLAYLALTVGRRNFPGTHSIGGGSTASAEPPVGEGLESTSIETITTISGGLPENLTQDSSALVSETLANSAPGLFSTILGLWISIVPYLLRAWG
jgi:hypothetical protein